MKVCLLNQLRINGEVIIQIHGCHGGPMLRWNSPKNVFKVRPVKIKIEDAFRFISALANCSAKICKSTKALEPAKPRVSFSLYTIL